VGVERWLVVVGGWVGTLLGPEASGPPALVATSCSLLGCAAVGVGVCGFVFLAGSSLCLVVSLCGGGGGLVGLLFEICIVDASIN
jgi:hypothetical protein